MEFRASMHRTDVVVVVRDEPAVPHEAPEFDAHVPVVGQLPIAVGTSLAFHGVILGEKAPSLILDATTNAGRSQGNVFRI